MKAKWRNESSFGVGGVGGSVRRIRVHFLKMLLKHHPQVEDRLRVNTRWYMNGAGVINKYKLHYLLINIIINMAGVINKYKLNCPLGPLGPGRAPGPKGQSSLYLIMTPAMFIRR